MNERTSDNEPPSPVILLYSFNSDIHVLRAGESPGLSERSETKFLKSIVCVGDEFTKEHVPVWPLGRLVLKRMRGSDGPMGVQAARDRAS